MASQNNLGYIVIEGSEGQMRGAALACDTRGIPVDFRYTDLVKPTRLERILYGSSLDTYLKEELMLESLLDSIEVDPLLWLCSDSDLLNPLKIVGQVKAALISESSHAPLDAAGHVETTSEKGVFLLQASENGAPLRLEFPDNVRPEEIKQAAEILTEAAKSMDVLEPFTRIQKALLSLSTGAN
ncbi:MAG: hypothetical protein IJS99_03740 [Synergistaceae bacterium]|nr:hypothetical protein [Synergistaceae bacterium]